MSDDLIILDSYDSPTPVSVEELLVDVRNRIANALDMSDVDLALDICRQLYAAVRLSGRGLAEALYMVYQRWEELNPGENFYDAAHREVGLHRHTVERYIKVAELNNGDFIPPDLRPAIEQRNIGEIIPIASAIKQGYTFTREDWEAIAEAPDKQTITHIVTEVKGGTSRANKLALTINREGNIYAHRNGEMMFVGYLEIDNLVPSVQHACERIIKNSGMLRQ
jgi:hypothetical protein